jgi:hypothetical protein
LWTFWNSDFSQSWLLPQTLTICGSVLDNFIFPFFQSICGPLCKTWPRSLNSGYVVVVSKL